MKRFSLFALSLIVCLPFFSAQAQNDMSKVEIKATQVAGNIYMLEGAGGNIGVSAGSDGILIVDDEFAPRRADHFRSLAGQHLERGATDAAARPADHRDLALHTSSHL